MRTLKFKAQPTIAFFATVNQIFGGGVCKTRNTPEHPGTPRNTPGTSRNTPGTARNSSEQPWNTPGTSHNTPEHPRNSQEHPQNTKNSGQRSDCSRIDFPNSS